MNSQVLRDYANIVARYPKALSGEDIQTALKEIDSIILKGRYRGGALVDYERVVMPTGCALISSVCVQCREVSRRRKRQVPLAAFLQGYKFVTGDAASL